MRIFTLTLLILSLGLATSLNAKEELQSNLVSSHLPVNSLPKVYLLPIEPIKNDAPANKETNRIEVINERNYARKEEDDHPVEKSVYWGIASASGFAVTDLLLGWIGISDFYINHRYGSLMLGIFAAIGFLLHYSTFVRKKAFSKEAKPSFRS